MVTALATALKVIPGVVLALLVVAAWNAVDDLRTQQALVDDWEKTTDYGVFYPHLVGDDREDFRGGGIAISAVEARDLYPVLDAQGGLYIDASQYRQGIPPSTALPTASIRVNTNYLDRFPILDETGEPIVVSPDEQAWVVIVPARYRPQEAAVRAFLEAARVGNGTMEGAVQGQERILKEPVPDRFRTQQVTIIWAADGQQVFTFDSTVSPDAGSTVTDPIVEVMTRQNSLTIDRLNVVTGNINTALKVRIDHDTQATLDQLAPTLRDLHLDDNLTTLVVANDAVLSKIASLHKGIGWSVAGAIAALAVMVTLDIGVVSAVSARLRRTFTVRRLHGIGFVRTYRELIMLLGAAWLAQAVVAVAVLHQQNAVATARDIAAQLAGVDLWAGMPRLAVVLVCCLLVDIACVAVATLTVERRNAATALKEL
ncbi:hypothetical protein [Catenuloplanes indicus]|uniref:Uncharacterized protein n=1 Tax=Catenuloplanes indicus TaxID=137267 RepID=A0AAE3W9J0_9ACTN|nr:hypothetical protein [Catenuloplanes indicus]MDQ0371159.1 hypothetical protein [Catenuloplanes indicus]